MEGIFWRLWRVWRAPPEAAAKREGAGTPAPLLVTEDAVMSTAGMLCGVVGGSLRVLGIKL